MFTICCTIRILGANINHVEADGWNALHFAVLNNRKDIVDLLLLNDINVDAITSVS
jgi:ankyrin repeat protein